MNNVIAAGNQRYRKGLIRGYRQGKYKGAIIKLNSKKCQLAVQRGENLCLVGPIFHRIGDCRQTFGENLKVAS